MTRCHPLTSCACDDRVLDPCRWMTPSARVEARLHWLAGLAPCARHKPSAEGFTRDAWRWQEFEMCGLSPTTYRVQWDQGGAFLASIFEGKL